jgi:hypothetical protein
VWGRSSAGRASRSQCEGREFDPPRLHHYPSHNLPTVQASNCDAVLGITNRCPFNVEPERVSYGVVVMNNFNFLKRKKGDNKKGEKKSRLSKIRTVRPPGEARAKHQARIAREVEETGIIEMQKKREAEFFDTGSLELQGESEDVSDPYATHTWEMDHEEGLRRIEDQSLGNRKKSQSTADNPYDTIVKKKGW